MVKAFEIAGLSKDIVSKNASAGSTAPSSMAHRLMAAWRAGVDRIVMLLCGTRNLRESHAVPDEPAGR
jgi:phenylalanyl-tRNA synthetase alpha subunit